MKPLISEGLVAIYGEVEKIGSPRSLLEDMLSKEILDLLLTETPEEHKVVEEQKLGHPKKPKVKTPAYWGICFA